MKTKKSDWRRLCAAFVASLIILSTQTIYLWDVVDAVMTNWVVGAIWFALPGLPFLPLVVSNGAGEVRHV